MEYQKGKPKHRYSDLTDQTFQQMLAQTGASLEDYAWLTGQTLDVVMSFASGRRNGKIPETNKLVLEYWALHQSELLDRSRGLRRSGLPTPRLSELTGQEFAEGLAEVGWTMNDFARLTGYSREGLCKIAKQAAGVSELVKLCWEYVRRYPLALQARPVVLTKYRQTRSRGDALWRTYYQQEAD